MCLKLVEDNSSGSDHGHMQATAYFALVNYYEIIGRKHHYLAADEIQEQQDTMHVFLSCSHNLASESIRLRIPAHMFQFSESNDVGKVVASKPNQVCPHRVQFQFSLF